MNNRGNQKFGRVQEKSSVKFDWDKNGKPIVLAILIAIAFLMSINAYIHGPFSNSVNVVDPQDDIAGLQTFSTSVHIEKDAKIKVFDHFSLTIPKGKRGFIRGYQVAYGTEGGGIVSPKLSESQYHDYVIPQFVTAHYEPSEGGGYHVYAGEREGEPLVQDTLRKYDMIAIFEDAIGFTAKEDECVFWQITPKYVSVRGAENFEILLPPGVQPHDFSARFYLETLYPKSRIELLPGTIKLKVGAARTEDTPPGGFRLMLSGTYEKPLKKNERLLVKLVWPKGFASKSAVIEATEKLDEEPTPEPEPIEPEEPPEPAEEY